MFELISGEHRQVPHRDTVPMLISVTVHLLVLGTIVVVPLLYISGDLPQVPAMLAFVAPAPAPPPPPPPPPAPGGAKSAASKAVPTSAPDAAPVETPTDILPEAEVDVGIEGGVPGGVEGGVPGGVEGGVLDGVPGGIVGGLPSDIPPPPPPQVERGPIRTGGALQAPAVVRHVAPVYPDLARRAQVRGLVILEAVVDRDGRVEDVKVLRSIPLLDAAAVDAVRQWQYSPLLLNGEPQRFIVTVTVSFNVEKT